MIKIKMKGWHYRDYENADRKKAYMFIHMNRTVRYILDDSFVPSKTGTLEHIEKELERLGYHFVEELPVDFITERHKRKMKRQAKKEAKERYKKYMEEHPEEMEARKLKREETLKAREGANQDQVKDTEWNKEYDKIKKFIPKNKEKRDTWIENYNNKDGRMFKLSIISGKTESGFDYEAYRLERKN